ncbi:RDD family protein [Candidatus Poriferisodalis sp.]|uniref:RDD family protein n=1 Tax=Candidatus Poriferisodalis sp. TaxID=3101277 RepID=UPI003B02B872
MLSSDPDPALGDNENPEYPDLFTRLGAWVYDSFMLIVVYVPVLIFLLVYWYATYGSPVCCGHSSEELTVMWIVPICAGVGFGFHRIYRLVVTGQSPGMRRVGIELVRLDNGRHISYPKALVRTILPPAVAVFGYAAGAIVGFENPLWGVLLWLILPIPALWNSANRGWHDQLAGAVIVTKRPE